MIRDPIIEEVRQTGHTLATAANHDLKKFFSMLRKAQAGYDSTRLKRPARQAKPVLKGDH